MTEVRFAATRAEAALIKQIAERFEALAGRKLDRLNLLMDIEACHCNGCPLDLIALAEAADDCSLAHDVAGITRHIDRETGKLTRCFVPRYAARSAEAQ